MPEFIHIASEIELIHKHLDIKNKIIVDNGCGTGNISRYLAREAKEVTGIDLHPLIEKANQTENPLNVKFKEGTAENLPINNHYADIIIFFASFHHISPLRMKDAISECRRVLKDNGEIFFVEPFEQPQSYYQLSRLFEDESEVQKAAYEEIIKASQNGFSMADESFYFLERSYNYFVNQISTYVEDEERKREIFSKAEKIILERGLVKETAVINSYCRVNVLRKL